MTSIRIDGLTPAGGSYSVATYLDESGSEVDPKRATEIRIVEYDADDLPLVETFASAGPGPTGAQTGAQRPQTP